MNGKLEDNSPENRSCYCRGSFQFSTNGFECSILFQALVVYECLSEWGQIFCAICPNPKLVITGGTSTAICVWETGTSKERAKSLTLKQVNEHKETQCRFVQHLHFSHQTLNYPKAENIYRNLAALSTVRGPTNQKARSKLNTVCFRGRIVDCFSCDCQSSSMTA